MLLTVMFFFFLSGYVNTLVFSKSFQTYIWVFFGSVESYGRDS